MSKQNPNRRPITIAGIEISVAASVTLVSAAYWVVIQKTAAEIKDLRDEIQRLEDPPFDRSFKPRSIALPIRTRRNEDGTKKKRRARRNEETKTLRN